MMHHSVKDNTRMGLVFPFVKFKPFDQFSPPPRTTSNFKHSLSCGAIQSSLFAVSTVGEISNVNNELKRF